MFRTRTAIRNMIRTGIPEKRAMLIRARKLAVFSTVTTSLKKVISQATKSDWPAIWNGKHPK